MAVSRTLQAGHLKDNRVVARMINMWAALCAASWGLVFPSGPAYRGVEQPRKKLECIGKRAECIENSPHAKNTTPGFRSILACDGPQKGCGILNFPDFVPRILYTWYEFVFERCVLSVLHPDVRDLTIRCSAQYPGAEG